MTSVTLKTLLGDYPVTAAVKSGAISSDLVTLDYADYPTPHKGFKPAVRDLAFDVCEMAIVTFLMAKADGVKLSLLPAVVMGRFQHPFLLCNGERGALSPKDLEGKRVAVRAWTVTTVTWLRGLLVNDYGVDPDKITWLTQEDAHVQGFSDPAGVERLPADADLKELLLAGDVDAAIIPGKLDDARLRHVIPDPETAAAVWAAKHNAVHVNHFVAVKTSLLETRPDLVAEVYRMLSESKRAAGLPKPGTPDFTPFGIAAVRNSLDIMIDYCFQQGLIPERYTVDELFAHGIG